MLGSEPFIEKVYLNKLETASSVQQLTIQNLQPGPIQYQKAVKRKRISLQGAEIRNKSSKELS